jgi:hypothetical protein
VRVVLAGVAACAAVAVAAAAPAEPVTTWDRHGIRFTYPRAWFATARPLSNGLEPVYRFAVGNFRFRRTRLDTGPCLAGIARQKPPTGVLVYAREARGADKRLSRFPPRPPAFRLPTASHDSACLGPGTRQTDFKERGRAFYLWISIGPRASARDRVAVARMLASLRIRALGRR